MSSGPVSLPPNYKAGINPKVPPPDDEAYIIIYNYVPSLALGVVGVVTFAIALAAHVFHWYAGKGSGTRVFQFLLFFGCLMEVVGYAFRIQSHYNPFLVNAFVVQYFMIVVAPVFFTAAIYLSLSIAARRAAQAGYGNILAFSPRKIVTIFVISDVVTTALQVAGAALIGVTSSDQVQGQANSLTPEDANHILLAGLAIQCFSFLCFLIILGLSLKKWPARSGVEVDTEKRTTAASDVVFTWRFPLVLIATSLLIWLRTLFRLGETAEGVFGPAFSSEAFFGPLEFLPVILALFTWAAFPLRKVLPKVE